MNDKPTTPAMALGELRQQARQLLVSYAKEVQTIARHKWKETTAREQVTRLIQYVKRDLDECNRELARIVDKHNRLSGKVLAHPYHPEMLKAGGEYLNFIDKVMASVGPTVEELTDLLGSEVKYLEAAVQGA